MKILHTADVHLKDMKDLDTVRVLAEAGNAAGCGLMLVCGDLFDQDSSVRVTEPGLAQALEIFRGQILVLPGNHDVTVLAGRKSLSSNSTVLNSPDMTVRKSMENFEIIAIPYREGLCFKDAGKIDCDPMNSILMAHGSYYSTQFFYEGAKDYFPMFEEDLKDKFRYAALGHYHKAVRFRLGGTLVVNPGSPRPTRESDIGKRQVSILDTDGWKSEAVFLDVPYFEKAVVNLNFSDLPETVEKKISSMLPETGGNMEKLFLEFSGTLSDGMRVEDLKDTANRLTREKWKSGNGPKLTVDTGGLKLIDGALLKNPFVASLLDEIGKLDSTPEEREKLRLFAIERIQSLF